MSYQLTKEQQTIVTECTAGGVFDESWRPTHPLVLINSTAGSSKSYSMGLVAKQLINIRHDHSTKYIVYGTANAAESKAAFGKFASVSTIHALAYQSVVERYKLNKDIAPFIHWKDIPSSVKVPFGHSRTVLDGMTDYCKSPFPEFDEWAATQNLNPRLKIPIKQLLNLMGTGKMQCTHDFYLKLFHKKLMSGELVLPEIDTLIVDEVNDLSRITLDIVQSYPAKQKILVGDDAQAIHHWMGCINAFDIYGTSGLHLGLTKSFRVDSSFAPALDKFLKRHNSPDATFTGMDYPPNQPVRTSAYIARTNAAVVAKMAECFKTGRPYKLAHSAKIDQMFKWPLALIYAKPGHPQRDSELMHLQTDIDDWGRSPALQKRYSKMAYLLYANEGNSTIKSAVALIMKFRQDVIKQVAADAKKHKKAVCDFSILTAHASKGKLN